MKKTSLSLFMMLLPLMASAYDEMVYSVRIDRICYNLNKTAKTAEVTNDGRYDARTYGYDQTIPSSITYLDETYSVTGIGQEAFYYCSGLSSVDIPGSVTYIGSSAFFYCELLPWVDIPNSVTSIGNFAFVGCTSFTLMDIPDGVTSIGKAAFRGCTSLATVVLPSSLTSIGEYAFSSCTSLTDVYCLAEDMPEAAINAFNFYSDVSAATLYVPEASVEAYEATAPWNEFGSIVGIDATEVGNEIRKEMRNKIQTEIESTDATKAEKKIAEIFSLDGKLQNALRKGINIVRYSDGTTGKVIKM